MARINKKIFQNLIKNHVVSYNFIYCESSENISPKQTLENFTITPQVYFKVFSKEDGVEIIEFSNNHCEIFQKVPSVNNIYHLFEHNNYLYAVRETRYKSDYSIGCSKNYTAYKLYPKLFVRDI